jgi:hypothetical protein
MSEGVNPASEIKAKMRAARVAALASLTPVGAGGGNARREARAAQTLFINQRMAAEHSR